MSSWRIEPGFGRNPKNHRPSGSIPIELRSIVATPIHDSVPWCFSDADRRESIQLIDQRRPKNLHRTLNCGTVTACGQSAG